MPWYVYSKERTRTESIPINLSADTGPYLDLPSYYKIGPRARCNDYCFVLNHVPRTLHCIVLFMKKRRNMMTTLTGDKP